MTTIPTYFVRSVDLFSAMVGSIGDDDWHRSTPCEDWDVRELVNHVTAEALWAPPLLAGRTIAEVGDRFDGDVLGDAPVTAWMAAADAETTGVSAPEALDRTVSLSMGETDAEEYVSQLLADHLIHAWDLGTALGIDVVLPLDLVAWCTEWFAGVEDLYRQAGAIGEHIAVPPEADPQTRLLAAFGRTGSDHHRT